MIVPVELLFSKTHWRVEHHHGEGVGETEYGDGSGLLRRHDDKLPGRYRCHVLHQFARNAPTQ